MNLPAGFSELRQRASDEDADDAIASPAFGALTAELRRAEANQHDVETLLPRLVRARGFGDADDIAAVLHYRVAKTTARPSGSGRARKAPRLIAGLIPEATGTMPAEMRQALTERRDIIEARADALLDTALTEEHEWITKLASTRSRRERRGLGGTPRAPSPPIATAMASPDPRRSGHPPRPRHKRSTRLEQEAHLCAWRKLLAGLPMSPSVAQASGLPPGGACDLSPGNVGAAA